MAASKQMQTRSAAASRRRGWIAAAAAVLVLGAAYAGVQKWRGPQVPAVTVQQQPLVRLLQFSARVETRSRVGVGSTIVGRVEHVEVREGDAVQAGQLLVQLEPAEQQAAVQQAQAGLTQAEADWARNQQLVAQGFLSRAALDEKRKARDVARAQLQAAQAQAAASADGGTELKAAEAQVQQAQAALTAAQAKLQQTRIVAPGSGKVLLRDVEPGQIVQPGTTLLQLALDGPTQIVAQVDERYLDQLREGQPATVVADAFPNERLAARVISIAPSVDAQRGAVEVKLALDAAPPAFLREDMTLSVAVETGKVDAALVVPLEALQGTQVLVHEDGKATPRAVQLGLRTLEAAQVQSGLQAGDTVLLPPAKAGQRVRAQERE